MDLYRRLRHTYGYGVHSPLAFRLVKDILNPSVSLAWYGYEDIEQWLERRKDSPLAPLTPITYRSSRQLRKDARLLLRFATFTSCSTAWAPANTPETLFAALHLADSRMIITSDLDSLDRANFILALGNTLSIEDLRRAMSRTGVRLLWLNPPEEAVPESIISGGVCLRGKRRWLAITGDSPLHLYSIL
ncbi:MAG: hypothetical protein NC097_02180 [Clostridium sp.]|nr:hypothetical protein [Prevotella sp.]MCM1428585.1 hypothetical protein [Clostridium sp.]MCM1474940.1 hypothetical protein [Muribaculaceae bacterium]